MECDLQVPSRKASRRHAEVYFDGDRIVVADLGSTNGTLVNGERVEGTRVLRAGDRIDVGGVEVTLCRDGEERAPPPEMDDTVVFDRSTVPEQTQVSFRGDLADVPVSEVLQMLAAAEKTGALGIVSDRGAARIWLRQGHAVHAEFGPQEGLLAAYAVCGMADGRFLFARDHPLPEATFDLPVTELLLEAHRRVDEATR